MYVVDLFCGCGGFGLGAELAGYKTLVAVDIDEDLQSAYSKNFPNAKVLNADLSQTNKAFWKRELLEQKIDAVVGGPPCQGYSRMGASNKKDSRRTLLKHFFRNVNLIQPKFFIMENVEGLTDKKNINELKRAVQLVDKKYNVLPPFIIDASRCGAATIRKRVIVIGYDYTLIGDLNSELFFSKEFPSVTVREAISDLPQPVPQHEGNEYGWGRYPQKKQISAYAKSMREFSLKTKDSLDLDLKRNLKLGEVSGCFDTIHSDTVRKRYQSIPEGSVDPVSRSKKLSWNGLCPTLRAGTGSDKGSYQAVRPLYPEGGRVITVREAARLQGFPDWFVFHNTKWHSFRMIGNSVSPLVSKHLMSVIKTKYRKK